MKKSTTELLKLIEKSSSFSAYAAQAADDFVEKPLHIYLEDLLLKKGLKSSDVIHRCGLHRTYGYDIFSGRRQPSRDKLLAVCFAMELSLDETQTLLKHTGYPQLYARIPRDSAILYALDHRMSLMDTNELLFEMNVPLLQ